MKLFDTIKNYLSLVKFAHTIFALPFALIGLFTGIYSTNNEFEPYKVIIIILAVFFARNSAMAFNRYIDRNIDKKNPRTRIREIPSGTITPKAAIVFIIVNILLFVLSALFLNKLCFYLSPLAIAIILLYSFFKRFSWCSHFMLGLALSIAPSGAYIAITGTIGIIPALYSLLVLLWVSGFDIIYSLQDCTFDKENNLKSVPVKFGISGALIISSVLHSTAIIITILIFFISQGGLLFLTGIFIFSSMLIYQHLIISKNDLSRVNVAFFTTNGLASIIFASFVISDLIFKISIF